MNQSIPLQNDFMYLALDMLIVDTINTFHDFLGKKLDL